MLFFAAIHDVFAAFLQRLAAFFFWLLRRHFSSRCLYSLPLMPCLQDDIYAAMLTIRHARYVVDAIFRRRLLFHYA